MDMAKPSCTYCKTVLPHHARAAQQVAVINQMMVDRNGNGIPDAFEGLLANAPQGQVHLIGTNAPMHMGPGAAHAISAYAVAHQHVHVAHAVTRTTNMVVGIVVASVVMAIVITGFALGMVFYMSAR